MCYSLILFLYLQSGLMKAKEIDGDISPLVVSDIITSVNNTDQLHLPASSNLTRNEKFYKQIKNLRPLHTILYYTILYYTILYYTLFYPSIIIWKFPK